MNTLTFSTSDFPEVTDCEVGKQETLTVTITPTKIAGDMVTANVDAVAYGEPAEEEMSEPEEMPMKGEGMMSKSPPKAIVAIGIPSRGKGY
jgi:hypothetical protein